VRHVRAVFVIYLVVILTGISFCTYLGIVGR